MRTYVNVVVDINLHQRTCNNWRRSIPASLHSYPHRRLHVAVEIHVVRGSNANETPGALLAAFALA
jgi:hypothetical protein